MTIEATLNVSVDEILKRLHNIWIGISLDNKKFTREYLTDLITFALQHTKETVLILIPGRIHAINIQYIDKLSRENSLKHAFALENEKRVFIKDILKNFNSEEQKKIIIANDDDVLTPILIYQQEVLMQEFCRRDNFYQRIIEIAQEILDLRGRTISQERVESISPYILHELPLFLSGVQKIATNIVHTIVLYPGIGKLDYLVIDILNKPEFAELKQKLKLTNKVGIVSIQ